MDKFKGIVSKKNVQFIDEIETKRQKNIAKNNVYPVFTRNDANLLISINHLREDAKYDEKNSVNYTRIENLLNEIFKKGYFNIDELNAVVGDKIEFEGKLCNKNELLASINVRKFLLDFLENSEMLNMNARDQNIVFNGIMRYLVPNVEYDLMETRIRQNDAENNIEDVKVDIKKGDIILAKDEIVTSEKLSRLTKIKEIENTNTSLTNGVSNFIAFILIFITYILLASSIANLKRIRKDQYFYISIIVEIIFLCFSIAEFYFFAGDNVNFIASFSIISLPAVTLCYIMDDKKCGYYLLGLNFFLYLLVPFIDRTFILRSIIETVILLEFINDRENKTNRSLKLFFTGLIIIILVAVFDISLAQDAIYTLTDCLLEILKCTVVYLFAYAANVLFGNIFNLPNNARLEYLANNSTPLLEKFKNICAGSFEHSESVADIAEEASKAIGANTLLVKVASRYHDVGKMEHPEYFVENQKAGESKHNVIKNKLSAAIIKSHVSLGIKLLRENHIPEEVIEVVSQHHGNDLIAYFYFEAKKNAGDAEIDLQDYSYRFSPPTSKESAILMLCDVAEAATRSKEGKMTEKELEEFVHMLIQGKIQHSQLDNSTLTIGELGKIEKSIVESLKAKFHKRISYPHESEQEAE